MKKVTQIEDFREFINGVIKAVYFSTPTCVVCHSWKPRVEPVLEQLGIPAIHIDLTELPSISGQYLVMGVPTLLIFVNGKEMHRFGAYDAINDIRLSLEKTTSNYR